jgi:AcrR family transcriptional regulator
VPNSQRDRSSRALKNDEALRVAAVKEILEAGVDHVSLREVSRRAGLTHGAAYARFENMGELLVDLWTSTLRSRMVALCELALRAAEKPDDESVSNLVSILRDREPADVAAVHVLLVARRIPTLHEEVEPFITNFLEPDEDLTPDSRATFSRAVSLFSLFTVCLLVESQYGSSEAYHDALEALLKEALLVKPSEVNPPTFRPPYVLAPLEFGDDLRSRIELATFSVVGKSGYAEATVSRIARRANSSPGAIYKTHTSKEGLLADSFVNVVGARWIAAATFSSILNESSLTSLLEFEASEGNELRRDFMLESVLAAAYSQTIRSAMLRQFGEFEVLMSRVTDIDDEQRVCLSHMIRTLYSLAIGVGWLATLTRTAKDHDFNQFAEPLRRTLLRDCLPDWESVSQQLLRVNPAAPRRFFEPRT